MASSAARHGVCDQQATTGQTQWLGHRPLDQLLQSEDDQGSFIMDDSSESLSASSDCGATPDRSLTYAELEARLEHLEASMPTTAVQCVPAPSPHITGDVLTADTVSITNIESALCLGNIMRPGQAGKVQLEVPTTNLALFNCAGHPYAASFLKQQLPQAMVEVCQPALQMMRAGDATAHVTAPQLLTGTLASLRARMEHLGLSGPVNASCFMMLVERLPGQPAMLTIAHTGTNFRAMLFNARAWSGQPPLFIGGPTPVASRLAPSPGFNATSATVAPPPGFSAAGAAIAPPPGFNATSATVAPPQGFSAAGAAIAPPPGFNATSATVAPPPGFSAVGADIAPPPGYNATSATVTPPPGFSAAGAPIAPPPGFNATSATVAPPQGFSAAGAAIAPPPGFNATSATVAPPPGFTSAGAAIAPPPGYNATSATVTPPPGFSAAGAAIAPPPGFNATSATVAPPPGFGANSVTMTPPRLLQLQLDGLGYHHLVLASQGVWAALGDAVVCHAVFSLLEQGYSCRQVAEQVTQLACERGCDTSMVVAVIDLLPCLTLQEQLGMAGY